MGWEIKFRAWDFEDKKMLECVSIATTRENKWISMFIKNGYIDSIQNEHVLMQYTGLKDINGREIYEGDIVFCQSGFHKYKTVVKIGEYLQDGSGNEYESVRCYGVYGEESRCSRGGYVPPSSINENESVEVIGNIYENPELLEGMQ